MNFLTICLGFNSKIKNSPGKLSEKTLKEFSSSVKYFMIYMSWEKVDKDFILKTIFSILSQFLFFLKNDYKDTHDSILKSVNFFDNHYKSKAEHRESTILVKFKNEDDELKYYKEAINNMYGNKTDFLVPNGTYSQLLKE